MNREQIEAGFDEIQSERFLRAHAAEARVPDFWRALNPHLTISDRPFLPSIEPTPVDPALVARCSRQILEEGYFQTPPLVSREPLAKLRLGAERVVAAGFPSGFTCLYDEFYQAFQGLDALFAPLLGERYLMVLQGLWTYLVDPGDPVYRRWTTVAPHRDTLGPDPRVLAGDVPSIINIWVPVTDVTTIDSCIYVVPATADPDYRSRDRRAHAERIRLQDVRGLPAPAGSVLGWSTHLVHWGSRSSPLAEGPRVAITVYFQRRDVAPMHPYTIELGAEVPFDDRLTWIGGSLGIADLWESIEEENA